MIGISLVIQQSVGMSLLTWRVIAAQWPGEWAAMSPSPPVLKESEGNQQLEMMPGHTLTNKQLLVFAEQVADQVVCTKIEAFQHRFPEFAEPFFQDFGIVQILIPGMLVPKLRTIVQAAS